VSWLSISKFLVGPASVPARQVLIIGSGEGEKRLIMLKISPENQFCLKALGKMMLCLLLSTWFFCSGCKPPPPPPPPPIVTYPSRVVTEDGATFLVNELRLPGTFQEFRLRRGTASMWVQPSEIQSIRFSGPERDRYRSADIYFMDGHRLKTEVFVDVLLEGNTDFLYWNMPLSRVQLLQFGTQ
jgi:hypothetical protein